VNFRIAIDPTSPYRRHDMCPFLRSVVPTVWFKDPIEVKRREIKFLVNVKYVQKVAVQRKPLLPVF
jgi:hypothetical protein